MANGGPVWRLLGSSQVPPVAGQYVGNISRDNRQASQALLFASTVLLGAKCVEITGQLCHSSLLVLIGALVCLGACATMVVCIGRIAEQADVGRTSFRQQISDFHCPICLSDHGQLLVRLPCGHLFHCSCLQLWKHETCPLCRCPY
ncbi:PJA1 [Symbiodinium natans]|uniref:PJA1 protein n=1 Tax=Symbiodinium natans TaxID=878477 RepID=A0A812QZK6_9DINO|nr:PJA1 [Symbiodinium natans]